MQWIWSGNSVLAETKKALAVQLKRPAKLTRNLRYCDLTLRKSGCIAFTQGPTGLDQSFFLGSPPKAMGSASARRRHMKVRSDAMRECKATESFICVVALALFVLSLSAADARKRDSKHFDYLTQVGIAVRTADVNCVSIANPSVPNGSRVFLISASPPQTISQAEVVGKQQNPCTQADGSGAALESYELRHNAGLKKTVSPDIVIYGFHGKFVKRDSNMAADLDGDGRLEFFRSCTSQEGIHFTIWSDKPLQGKRRWHRYVYLGYSLEPTCTKPETESGPA